MKKIIISIVSILLLSGCFVEFHDTEFKERVLENKNFIENSKFLSVNRCMFAYALGEQKEVYTDTNMICGITDKQLIVYSSATTPAQEPYKKVLYLNYEDVEGVGLTPDGFMQQVQLKTKTGIVVLYPFKNTASDDRNIKREYYKILKQQGIKDFDASYHISSTN